MAKVTTSEKGIQTTQVIENPKPKAKEAAPPLEMKAGDGVTPPIIDGPGQKPEVKAEPEVDEHVDAEDRDLSDITLKEVQDKARRKIGKYAQRWQSELKAKEKLAEEAADAERFAEQLFNEREEYRKKVAELEARIPKEQPAPEELAPNENDAKYRNAAGEFEWKKFSTDNAAFEAKRAIAEDRKAQAQAAMQAQQQAEDAQFKQRIAEAEKKHPDWLKTVTNSPIVLQNEALAFIKQSDYGTDIAYYLAQHPNEAEKIKALHPIRAIAAIRDIEAGFEKPKQQPAQAPAAPSETVERVGAPAPITPIISSGATPVPVDPAKMNFQQLRAYEKDRARAKRR